MHEPCVYLDIGTHELATIANVSSRIILANSSEDKYYLEIGLG